ncbi:MAG: HD domain-containing phosphohydrolase [Candidatus Sumerlaeia bacterium]
MEDSAKILIADDNEVNRLYLSDFIESLGYQTHCAANGVDVLEILKSKAYWPDLVLLDNLMPEMNGFEVLKKMKVDIELRDLPVIMISATNEMDTVASCIEIGADDYLTKPFNSVLLRARISSCLAKKQLQDERLKNQSKLEEYNNTLQNRVKEQVDEISTAHMATIFAMSKLAESRDEDTGEHLERMREYARIIAEYLSTLPKYRHLIDETFIENIFAACPLHDIGKVGIPDRILLKPGKLTKEEFDIMKYHPCIAADTLRAVEKLYPTHSFLHMGIEIAESHHEKWNGQGYPKGLQGEEIPISGRIVSLGDVYDALTTQRCYKEAFSHEKSKEIILEGRGAHFDPDVVDGFIAREDEFLAIRKHFQDSEKVMLT